MRTWFITGASRGCGALIAQKALAQELEPLGMNPPLRLPLGSDTVAVIEAKNAATAKLLEAWRATAVSTDFAPVSRG